MTGRPLSSRKSLSMPGPMRVPFPPATIRTLFMLLDPMEMDKSCYRSNPGGWPPIENPQLYGRCSVVVVRFRSKRQIEAAFGQLLFGGIPPDTFTNRLPVGHPKLGVLIVRAHSPGRSMQAQLPAKELNRWIASAGLLQLREFINTFERQFPQGGFRIEAQSRL